MHRIDTSTAQVDKFGQGKNGFTNGDPSSGRKATDLNSDMWDAVQEEICGVVETAGISLEKAQHNQLYLAIKAIIKGDLPDALIRGNNLSDVGNKAQARSNLELKAGAVTDIQTSKDDTTAGRLLLNGSAIAIRTVAAKSSGSAIADANNLPANSVSFCYGDAANPPGITGSVLDFSGLSGAYNVQICASYSNLGSVIKFRTHNGDAKVWNAWYELYHTGKKPTTQEIYSTSISLGANQNLDNYQTPGMYHQSTNANTSAALKYPENNAGTLIVVPNAGVTQIYYAYNSSRVWTRSKYQTSAWTAWAREYNTLNKPSANDVGAIAIDSCRIAGFASNNVANPYMRHTDSNTVVTLAPQSWVTANFQSKGSYYTTAQSDGRYVQNIKLGAQVNISGGTVPAGCCVTFVDGGEKMEGIGYKPIQMYIAGAWKTLQG